MKILFFQFWHELHIGEAAQLLHIARNISEYPFQHLQHNENENKKRNLTSRNSSTEQASVVWAWNLHYLLPLWLLKRNPHQNKYVSVSIWTLQNGQRKSDCNACRTNVISSARSASWARRDSVDEPSGNSFFFCFFVFFFFFQRGQVLHLQGGIDSLMRICECIYIRKIC